MNPLYNALNNSNALNGSNALLQRFQQFRNSFKGDPRQQIQQMLNSGRITQAQYDQAVKTANQLYRTLLPGAQR